MVTSGVFRPMSELLRVSFIAEGKTDITVLKALVGLFLNGEDYVPNEIHPPTSDYAGDHGALGGGWKGVLKWCENQGVESTDIGGFAGSLVLRNCDCLIIHVDADIAEESDLATLELGSLIEPARTCDNIRNYMWALFDGGPFPSELVICTPAQCTEAWVFVALYTSEVENYIPIESRREVERLLIGRPDKLVRDKDGAAKKDDRRYRAAVHKITQNWPAVVGKCTQARLFESEFRALRS